MKLYAVGGRQKREALDLEEWHRYEAAIVATVDSERGHAAVALEFQSAPEIRPDDGGSVLFKAATRQGERLYACTQTEVVVYRLPTFEQLAHISLARFNDVHHVRPREDGSLLVVSTGLDCVLHLSAAGDLIREWPVLQVGDAPVWDAGIDYRKLATTKPHRAHPNYAFELDGRIWATRFEQRDAVCVEHLQHRIPIDIERPHDGVVHEREIYFTTVDGNVVVADAASRAVVRRFDLNAIARHGIPLGWCRGIHVLARDQVLVGFSRIRRTRFKDNLRWVVSRARGRDPRSLPTRIAQFDLARGVLLREWSLEEAGVNAVFSIHPAD